MLWNGYFTCQHWMFCLAHISRTKIYRPSHPLTGNYSLHPLHHSATTTTTKIKNTATPIRLALHLLPLYPFQHARAPVHCLVLIAHSVNDDYASLLKLLRHVGTLHRYHTKQGACYYRYQPRLSRVLIRTPTGGVMDRCTIVAREKDPGSCE